MFQRIAALEDLWSGDLMGTIVAGVKVVVIRIDDSIYCYEDRCAHLGLPLSDGKLDGRALTCSAHHWQYDVLTGRGINPTTPCLARFAVMVEAGLIYVDVTRRL